MITLHFLLIILALVSFFVATIRIEPPRISLVPLGLFLWCLAMVVAR